MKRTLGCLLASAVIALGSHAQTVECIQTEFAGKATQSEAFEKQLGDGVKLDVKPMRSTDDPLKSWFKITAVGADASSFVFNPSDSNWLLAPSGFWATIIGGPAMDLHAALDYRARYLLLPLTVKEKERARDAARMLAESRTPGRRATAIAKLRKVRMAHVELEITDFALGDSIPPTSVKYVTFNVKVTFPRDFLIAGELPVSIVNCPDVPNEVIDDIGDPHRHEYSLKISK